MQIHKPHLLSIDNTETERSPETTFLEMKLVENSLSLLKLMIFAKNCKYFVFLVLYTLKFSLAPHNP